MAGTFNYRITPRVSGAPVLDLGIDSFCELTEDGKRIQVYFNYNAQAVASIKKHVQGARFVDKTKGGPYWTIPKDMMSARQLREVFGDGLVLGKGVRKWAKAENRVKRNLNRMAKADDAKLKVLPEVLPELDEFLRPFQKADVAFMARTSVMNANEQGLGKTIEAIAAVFEAELDYGAQLVIAPKTSLETVWEYELDTWVGDPVFILSGDQAPDYRKIAKLIKKGDPFWFVTTAAQVRKGLPDALKKVKWKTLIIDEFHKTGLTNISGDFSKGTQFGRAIRDVKRERTFLISGTPIGGRPIKLWGALHHMRPEVFTSKWKWAEHWLVVTVNAFGGREVGDIKPHLEDKFYPEHAQFIVRRLKSEVLPQLPDKQYIDVWCPMLRAQARQYKMMDDLAEVRIEGERLSAQGVLAEMTRLKQFATAERAITKREVVKRSGEVKTVIELPIKNSNKLEPLIERLSEIGIDPLDPTGDACAVVASQSKVYIEWIADQLNARGIKAELITSKVKGKDRADLVRRFQKGGPDAPRVICCTTTAGGVAITLDRADTVHILDETFDPDDQQQLEDRIHRISRIHQVMCYYYRSLGTIEEDIYELNLDKAITTSNIMDVYRARFKEAA